MATPAANTPTDDSLHELGLVLLDADYRYIGIAAMLIVGFLAVIKLVRCKRYPTLADIAGGVLSLLSIYGAIIVASIFLLTKPPAIGRLQGLELAGVGIISFVLMFFLGLHQLHAAFWKRPPRPKGPATGQPASGTT